MGYVVPKPRWGWNVPPNDDSKSMTVIGSLPCCATQIPERWAMDRAMVWSTPYGFIKHGWKTHHLFVIILYYIYIYDTCFSITFICIGDFLNFPARPLVRHCKIRSKWKIGSWSWAVLRSPLDRFGEIGLKLGHHHTSPTVNDINLECSWKNHP